MARDIAPAQPGWRRKPAHRRGRLRKMQSSATAERRRTRRPSPSTGVKAGLRLPDRATVRLWAHRALMAVLAGGLAVGLVTLLRLPQLSVSATSTLVGGAQRLAPETIYLASGIEGRNIFLIRSAEVATAVRQLPGVQNVQVHVRLPNQVLIDVWEYAPLVAWRTVTTTVWLAADGSPVPQAGEAPPLTLVDRSGTFPAAGNPLVPILLQDLQVLHTALPDVKELSYSREQGLAFRTSEGWEVWLGEGGSVADKLRLLAMARREIARLGRQIRVIDLRQGARQAIWW